MDNSTNLEMLLVMGLLWGLLCGLGCLCLYFFYLRPKKNKKKSFDIYNQQLINTGFEISKRILTNNFLGILVDYASKKVAIRTSHVETTPKIYDFNAISNYDVIEGAATSVTTGKTTGGFLGSARTDMTTIEVASPIHIRITIHNAKSGVSSLSIPMYTPNPVFPTFLSAGSSIYQGILECSRTIIDELDYITTKMAE